MERTKDLPATRTAGLVRSSGYYRRTGIPTDSQGWRSWSDSSDWARGSQLRSNVIQKRLPYPLIHSLATPCARVLSPARLGRANRSGALCGRLDTRVSKWCCATSARRMYSRTTRCGLWDYEATCFRAAVPIKSAMRKELTGGVLRSPRGRYSVLSKLKIVQAQDSARFPKGQAEH
jgi:hypothetical protein